MLFYAAQADPAQALNVPAIPVGAILAAVHPFVSRPPYILSWLKGQVSSQEMMQPELYDKLLLNNFCKYKTVLTLHLRNAICLHEHSCNRLMIVG